MLHEETQSFHIERRAEHPAGGHGQGGRRRIERLVTALATGSDELPSVRSALVGLERERERLEKELARANERAHPREDRREQAITDLLERLENVRQVLESGSAEERKAV